MSDGNTSTAPTVSALARTDLPFRIARWSGGIAANLSPNPRQFAAPSGDNSLSTSFPVSTSTLTDPVAQFMPPLKTYIVEDSPVIRENLIAALEEMVPVQVVGTAEDEATAVSWLTKPSNECNLVIVDIFLKAGSGLGVLRAAGDAAKPFKLVVLSNYATPDMRRKCLELGADRVFDKSNEIDALILYCERLASSDGGGGSGFSNLS